MEIGNMHHWLWGDGRPAVNETIGTSCGARKMEYKVGLHYQVSSSK